MRAILALTASFVLAPTPGSPQAWDPMGPPPPTPFANTVFVSGRVVTEGGAEPGGRVRIEASCPSTGAKWSGAADKRGRFNFQMEGVGGAGAAGSGSLYIGSCELTASLSGFRLARVSLSSTRGIGQFGGEILITLHRLAEDEGVTVSMTELKAPAGARKAEEKGAEAMRKRNWQEARTHLSKAVGIYPEYASAWHELGLVLQQLGLDAEARAAWNRAVAADSKFLQPYVQLAAAAVRAEQWREAADIAGRAIALKPVEYPVVYFYHSAALYRLGSRELAEKSAREAIRLDPNHQVPRAEFLLGVMLANRRDYAGAARHFKAYLGYAPNAPDAAEVRRYISEAERNAAKP